MDSERGKSVLKAIKPCQRTLEGPLFVLPAFINTVLASKCFKAMQTFFTFFANTIEGPSP